MLVITKDRTRRRPWYRILQVLLILVCLSHVAILHAQDTDNDGVVDALDMDDDNDGILDVLEYPLGFVHVDDATNSISVYLTNGVATFSDTAITTVMSEDIGVGNDESTLMGDLNNDGVVDLFFADDSSNVIRVYLNNGDGTFNATAITTAFTNNAGYDDNEAGFLRDVTGDGNLDFMHVVVSGNAIVRVYAGDGTGGFNTTAITSTLSGTDIGVNNNENTLIADLNGDGFEDLFFADDSSNVIHVYLNNRDGTFNATAITTTFNNDAGQDGGEAAFLSRYIVNANTDGTTAANDLDLDSDDDGIPDNIEAQATATYIAPGTFTDANNNGLHDGYESAQGGTDILPVDTDGDSIPDFRDTNSDGDSTADIDESGLGAVGAIQANGLGANVGGSATYTSDDINGLAHDGSDFNLLDTDNDTNANGANAAYGIDFDYRDVITDVDTDDDGVFDRVDIDDDNDGIIDANEVRVGVLWVNAQNSSTVNYEMTYKRLDDPTGFETTPVEGTATANHNMYFSDGNQTHGAAMGDVNGDGITDLVNFNENTNRVEVFLGDLSGNFSDGILTSVTGTFNTGNDTGYGAYDLIDVDGDGDDDYIWARASNSATLTSNVLLSNGDGTFQSTVVVDTSIGGSGMYFSTGYNGHVGLMSDVNNDGFADLVYASEANNRIDIFLGDGAGNFADRIETASWTGNTGNVNEGGYMTMGDFNNDGYTDLLWSYNVGGGNTANIEVTLGNGDGSFQAMPLISSATLTGSSTGFFDYEGAAFVISGDANADGHIDLIQFRAGAIGLLLGDGTGNFADGIYTIGLTGSTIGKAPASGTTAIVSFSDIDNDGIVNSIDLDSDNDGIPDNIEAQATASYIPPSIFTDANNNGLYDVYESVQGGTDILPVDTDGDGTPDFRDTNSDGDSTADIDESGLGAVGTIQANGLGANVGGAATYTSDAINGLAHDGSNFNLLDTDNDTNADGANADPSNGFDFDYRDHIMDLDTDGDMVFDRFDIDDDNDGILDGIEGGNNNFGTLGLITDTTIWQDLINETPNSVIEDFEGYSTGTNINSLIFEEFALTATPSSQQTIQGTAHGTAPVSGSRQISVEDSSSDDNVISISFNNPVLGFGFYVGDFDVGGSTNFIVEVNGTQIWNTMGGSPVTNTANDGQQYIVGNGIYNFIGYYNPHNLISTVTITLKTSGGENIVLDDFYTIPFSDTDNDGVANSIDLDSDNDGIPDNIEAQATATYISPSIFADANNNGLYDVYESAQGGTDILPVDTDGDGIPDFRDTNSEGDSTSDIDESGLGAVGAIQANGLGANVGGSATYTSDDINGLAHDGTNFNLTDTDNDTNANGTNAAYGIDFDYRDAITDVDTDDDGVFDRVDIDDDNDGVIDANESRVGLIWANAQNSSTLNYEITYKSTSNPTGFETTPLVGTATANHNIYFDNGRGTHGSMMGDVNGDGITDLVNVREDTKRVEVFLGDSFGNFADAILTTVSGTFNTGNGDGNVNGAAGYGVYDLIDVNGDGNEDYIWANAQNSSTLNSNVLLSNGDGTFQSTAVVDTATGGNNMYFDTRRDNYAGLIGDVNNDGFADLVYASEVQDRMDVFLGDGLGNFADRIETVSWTGNTGNENHFGYMTVADFNSDGNADVLWAHNVSGGNTANIEVTFSNGDGTFQTIPQVSTATIIGGNTSYFDYEGNGYFVISGDANADGHIDIIQIAESMIGILLGDGTGNFADAVYTNGFTGTTIGNTATYGTVALATFLDTDTDGVANRIDLDSDNDGIPDNIEAQATATYISPGIFADANNNGLHDMYESVQGGTDILPVDTDGDGTPDFRDTNSDGDSTSDIDESGLGAVGTIQTNGLGINVGGSVTYTSGDINGLAHDGSNFNLSDTDNDTNTDGANADPSNGFDFDYRDHIMDFDTDGDMVFDRFDIDDDNDGILDGTEGGNNNFGTLGLITDTTIWQNLINETPNSVVEDFEGYSTGTNINSLVFEEFALTATPSDQQTIQGTVYGTAPVSGSRQISVADSSSDDNVISISFNNPVLGFGFYAGDFDLGGSTNFIVEVNGIEIWNTMGGSPVTNTANDGQQYIVGDGIYNFIGYYNSHNLISTVTITLKTSGGENIVLDNFYTIPFLDTDNDGVANSIDLDSDNDGIPDNIEAQTTATYIAPGTFTDANNNGLHDSYESTQGGTDILPVDTDGDGIPDFRDTNSDNDSNTDVDESGLGAIGAIQANGLGANVGGSATYISDDINGLAHDGTNFNISDTDNDTNADGANAAYGIDFDYRDAITDVDTDDDGVFDRVDIDDDNDGIIDANESRVGLIWANAQNSSTLNYEITYKSTSNPTLFETTPVVGTLTANGNITFDNGRGTHGSMMGDVNGDGITDLVNVREDTKRVEVFLGDSFGNFADAILTTVSGTFNTGNGDGNVNGSPGYGVYDLLDVNGDGNDDYIWANAQNSTTLNSNVLLSNGDGTFQSTAVVDTATGGNNMYFDTRRDNNVGLMGDVNNDGFADLVFVNDIYTRIDVFLGDGSGNFADRIETASWTGNTGNANQRGYMTVADFNSDGNADVLWAHNASGGNTANIEVTLGNGNGTFQTMPQVSTTTIIGGNDSYIDYEGTGYFVISGDANADGHIDLIQIAESMIGILLGDGTGNFADAVYTNGLTGSTIGKNPGYGTVALATFLDTDTDGVANSIDLDSDNDGIPDNIEAQATATYISPGTFTDANNNGVHDGYESAQGGTDILPIDTDGDGTPDFRDTNSDGDSAADIDESGLGAVGAIQANGLGANVGGSATYTSNDINGLAHDGSNFSLADTDNDTNADGTNTILLDIDFDYRDNRDDTDTDGDMVIDVIDIDDDNDGILDVIEGGNNNFATTGLIVDTIVWQNLVDEMPNATLEDFGTYSPGTNVDAIDFADFNISVTPNESIHSYNSGSIWMSNANTNYSASISFDEPVLGFGFSLVDLGHSATVLIISIDGTEVWNSSSSGSSTSMTNSIDGREVAVGLNVDTFFGYYISTPFTSVSVTVQNGSNDGFALDNIYTVPYLDMDNDGVANAVDLDSDNDGIPDNIEAQATASYIVPSPFTDVDGDGLHDSYDEDTDVGTTTMVTSIGLLPVNTDGIDAVDYLDTDADNDGIFDIIESGLANNDVDNDGMTDGAVGANGLDDAASIESTDAYTDVNGLAHDGTNFSLLDTDNDTHIDGTNADPSTGVDFDYRDAIDSYKVFMRHGKFFRGGTKKKMEFGKRN